MKSFTVTKSKPVMVRPASMTNDGIYFMSNLDQNMAFYVEMLFCFNADEKKMPDNAIEVLKKSLAEALVLYYPLAGKLDVDSNKKLVVNLTGEGVVFVEAVADSQISSLGDITMCDQNTLASLVHTFPYQHETRQVSPLSIQVTKFKCGGFIMGVVINHSVADILSITQFMSSWAEIARGVPLTIPPFLDRSLLKSREPPEIKYPHHELSVIEEHGSDDATHHQEHQWQVRSFHFGPEKLAKLKKIVTDDGLVDNCTSFTALTAFFWRARTKALNLEPHQQTKLFFPVDGRSRFNPPLPKGLFGNGIGMMCCLCTAGELMEKPLSFAVKLVQETINLATEDYIRSGIDYYEVTRGTTHMPITALLISTWTRLPWNACDFGWGKPTQLGCATVPGPLALFLPCTNERNGTKVLMGLPAPSMKIFQELTEI